ncbi:MAG: DUF4398 domain-containing protein [Xanthomonadales bacterium]|nr:DUF4398 domain-containing protein [Xanthomonadales bacterium]
MNNYLFKIISIISLSVLLSACATSPQPQPRAFATAEAVIEQAEKIGAGEYAPTELTHARERLAQAREAAEASGRSKSPNANFLIEQAEINAELAIARSQLAKTRDRVNQKRKNNAKLLQTLQQTYTGEFE